jgi:hypothetical protein
LLWGRDVHTVTRLRAHDALVRSRIAILVGVVAVSIWHDRAALAADDDTASGAAVPADSDPSRPASVTGRAALGLGVGSPGVGTEEIAARASLSFEGWFGEHMGMGAFCAASGQTAIFSGTNLTFAGVALASRTSGRGSYVLFTMGAGAAWGTHMQSSGVFGDAPPPPDVHYSGVSYNATLAWLARTSSGFEPGGLLAVDVTSWGAVTVTANLALGFGAPSR